MTTVAELLTSSSSVGGSSNANEANVQPVILKVASTVNSVARESRARADYYVSTMERYLHTRFYSPVHLVAMAAVSGIAITAAIAARAENIGTSVHENILRNSQEEDHSQRYAELEQKYSHLNEQYNIMVSAMSQSESSLSVTQTTHKDAEVETDAQWSEVQESIKSLRETVQQLEHEKEELAESNTIANERMQRMEQELSDLRDTHAQSLELVRVEADAIRSTSEAKSDQLLSIQNDLNRVSEAKANLQRQHSTMLKDIESKQADVATVRQTQYTEMQSAITSKTAELQAENTRTFHLTEVLTQLKGELSRHESDNAALQGEIASLKVDREIVNKAHSDFEKEQSLERQRYDQQESLLQHQIDALNQQHAATLSEFQNFRTMIEQQHSLEFQRWRAENETLVKDRDIARAECIESRHENEVVLAQSKVLESQHKVVMHQMNEEHARSVRNLRLDVERLQSELHQTRQAHQSEMTSIEAAYQNELQTMSTNTRTELTKLHSMFQRVHSELDQKTTLSDDLRKLLEQATADITQLKQVSADKSAVRDRALDEQQQTINVLSEEIQQLKARKAARRASRERVSKKMTVDDTPLPAGEASARRSEASSSNLPSASSMSFNGSSAATSPGFQKKLGSPVPYDDSSSTTQVEAITADRQIVTERRVSSIGRRLPWNEYGDSSSVQVDLFSDKQDTASLNFEDQRAPRSRSGSLHAKSIRTKSVSGDSLRNEPALSPPPSADKQSKGFRGLVRRTSDKLRSNPRSVSGKAPPIPITFGDLQTAPPLFKEPTPYI